MQAFLDVIIQEALSVEALQHLFPACFGMDVGLVNVIAAHK
jgi:hypothetical protein